MKHMKQWHTCLWFSAPPADRVIVGDNKEMFDLLVPGISIQAAYGARRLKAATVMIGRRSPGITRKGLKISAKDREHA